jgi:HlyD family secretion protein
MDDARSVLTQDESLATDGIISRRELQTSQTTFKTAEARYQQAVAQLNQARLSRQASVNTGVVQSNAGVEQAQAQVKQAEAQVQQSAANIKLAQTQVEQGLSQVEQAEAGLHLAELNQNNLTIISPIDGVVVSRSVEIGQTVAASLSAPTLFTIANDLTKMQVIANVDQSDIGLIENARKANFTVDAFVGDEFSGTIRQIRLNPVATQNVVTYNVVIDVNNPDMKLKPGMTANLEFTIDERENAVRIPNAALRFAPTVSPEQAAARGNSNSQTNRGARRQRIAVTDTNESAANQAPAEPDVARERPTPPTEAVLAGQTRVVWVLNEEKNLERRRIKIGITDGTATEVVEGNLTEGESVVTGQNVDTAAGNPQNGQTAPGFGGAPRGAARGGRRTGGGR